MVKLIAAIKRLPQMPHEEFVRYWLEEHSKLASQTPHLRRYVINIVDRSFFPRNEPPFDGFAEMWFDTVEEMNEGMAWRKTDGLREDEKKFIGEIQGVVVREHVIIE